MAKSLNYTKLNLFFDLKYGEIPQTIIKANFAARGVTIVTPDNLIIYNETDPDYPRKVARHVKQSDLKLLVYFLPKVYLIGLLASFEEEGLKGEDIVGFNHANTLLSYQAKGATSEQLRLVNKYGNNILTLIWEAFKGDIGTRFRNRFLQDASIVNWNDCYIYDSMGLAVTALDFALKRGLDFYSWKEMMKAVRSVRLLGCSGMISLSFEYNDRKDIGLASYQTQNVDGQLQDVHVLTVSLSRSEALTSYNPIVWSTGVNVVPSMNRLLYKDCPFPEQYRRDSKSSVALKNTINFSLTSLTFVAALVSYFRLYRKDWMFPVVEPILLGTQDIIVIYSALVEVLVIGLMSPINIFDKVSTTISGSKSLKLLKVSS